jgi:competence protein ComEA
VVLLLGALVLGGLRYRSRPPAPPLLAAIDTPPDSATTSVGHVPPLVVHVAGAVLHPGVVRIPAGSRIVDALDATGGPRADADLDRLNLAAPVADGDRVTVAAVGDPPGVSITNPSAPASGGEVAPGTPLDLNAATLEQLEALPGIGPALAASILAERDRRGGFTSVEDLLDVRGIGDARFAQLRDLVVV